MRTLWRNSLLVWPNLALFSCGAPPSLPQPPAKKEAKPPAPPVAPPPAPVVPPSPPPAPPVEINVEGAELTVALQAIDLPAQDEIPLSKIVLRLQESGKAPIIKDLGEFPGCDTELPTDEKTLAAIRCFWSGGEDLFELSQESDLLLVRHTLFDDSEATPLKPEERLKLHLTKNAKIKLFYPGDSLELAADHIGPYKLSATTKEISALPNATPQGELAFSFEQDGVEVYTKAPGVVCRVTTSSPGPKTKDGLGVGSTIGDFQKLYGAVKWDATESALQFEKEPGLSVEVSFEETGREKKLPRPEAKVTIINVGDCEATQ